MATLEIRPGSDGRLPALQLPTGAAHRIILLATEPAFEVRVLDDVGEPVEGVEIELLVAGESATAKSAGDGVVRHDAPGADTAGVRFPDMAAVRALLEPRFAADHAGDTPSPSADVLHVPLRGTWQGATLDRGKRRTLVLLPSLVCVRLTGLNFDTSKSFLLPGAMRGIRRLREIYEDHPEAKLVVCGHTDTAGSKKYNLDLSLERAESLIAFLTDRVDAWEAWFQQGKPNEKRWGTREIQHMLKTLPSEAEPYYAGKVDGDYGSGTRGGVERFQEDHGLPKTGNVDASTRRAIITDYMAIDGTSLPAGVLAEPHGCGEFFRAAETGDSVALAENRRVDVFFFDGPVHPPNPGPHAAEGEAEYPAWRDRSRITHRVDTDGFDDASTPSQIRVLLRSNSGCVPLSDRPYRIHADGVLHEGVTDAEGLASVHELPSGDYDLEVEATRSVVPTRPKGSEPVLHVLGGFFLRAHS